MAASSNGTKQSPEKQEVVVGLLRRLGQLHGTVHNLVKVWLRVKGQFYCWVSEGIQNTTQVEKIKSHIYLKHLLILSSKQWHRAKNQLEQLQVKIRKLNIGTHLWQSFQKIFHEDGGKQGGGWEVGQERICYNLGDATKRSVNPPQQRPQTYNLTRRWDGNTCSA